jgi:hypothetical protein
MDLENIQTEVAGRIDAFRASGDTAKLREAANLIATIMVRAISAPEERQRARSTKLALWLSVLDAIDTAKDPNFDPSDAPAARVPVPDTPMKPGCPVRCAEGIADPEVRRRYDLAVAANAEKTTRYRLQKELRQIDAELTPRAESYIAGQYPKSRQNLKEVDEAMAAGLHDPGRKSRIHSMVAPAAR